MVVLTWYLSCRKVDRIRGWKVMYSGIEEKEIYEWPNINCPIGPRLLFKSNYKIATCKFTSLIFVPLFHCTVFADTDAFRSAYSNHNYFCQADLPKLWNNIPCQNIFILFFRRTKSDYMFFLIPAVISD